MCSLTSVVRGARELPALGRPASHLRGNANIAPASMTGQAPCHTRCRDVPCSGMKIARMNLRVPPEWVTRIEDWRREQPVIPSRSEAVRILVDRALDAIDAQNPPPAEPAETRKRRAKKP